MYSLVYISSVFNDFTEEMIQDILAVSREKINFIILQDYFY